MGRRGGVGGRREVGGGRWWCGVAWCGVWCGVVWCGVVWCGVVWCGVVYCIVLYCIVLYCIVLYCIVLYCIVLYCIVLYCNCIVPYRIVLYCVVLCCILWCGVVWWTGRGGGAAGRRWEEGGSRLCLSGFVSSAAVTLCPMCVQCFRACALVAPPCALPPEVDGRGGRWTVF